MRFSNRLSATLHALLHLAERAEPVTAEAIGAALGMNPVVIAQTMVALRAANVVRAARGPNAWVLARDPAAISVRDVYAALGEPALFVLRDRGDDATCLVEKTVGEALTGAFADAQASLVAKFALTSLADLSSDSARHTVA